MLVLKLLGEKHSEIRVPHGDFTLGRSLECDYSFEDSRISRKHARFSEQETGGWLVEDLGSTHKTFVNGEIIESPTRLVTGDLVQVGNLAFEIAFPSSGVSGPGKANHVRGVLGSAESITYRAEELRKQWLQVPPEDEIWQRLHRVHVNCLLEIAQTLNLAGQTSIWPLELKRFAHPLTVLFRRLLFKAWDARKAGKTSVYTN